MLAGELAGALSRAAVRIGAGDPGRVDLAPPLREARGDLATGLPRRLSARLGRPPGMVGRDLLAALEAPPGLVAAAEEDAGFLNFRLTDEAVARAVFAMLPALAAHVAGFRPAAELSASDATVDEARRFVIADVVAALDVAPPTRVGPVTLADGAGRRPGRTEPVAPLAAEVGEDALRYALLSRRAEAGLLVEVPRWRRPTGANPAWRAQMAHARLGGIFRTADVPPAAVEGAPLPGTLDAGDLALLHRLARLPGALERAAEGRDPHAVVWFVDGLAAAVPDWAARDTGQRPERVPDRLRLARAARVVLAYALTLLGLAAPDWI